IPYVDPDQVDGRATELLAEDAGYYGRPSLFARAMATNPRVFDVRNAYHRRLVREGDLAGRVAELAYLAVSVANECEYCTASHGETLVETAGGDPAEVEAVRNEDLDSFDQRERSVIRFATAVAMDPKRISEEDLAELRAVGFDDPAIVELLTICTAAVAANTFADALGIHPSDRPEPFVGTE
ncbi:MAG: peroxidase-related enzyme, partial [Halobacteriales archaeon]|nr:peroxidase-related enzyme [Halobacteriales archaeon]